MSNIGQIRQRNGRFARRPESHGKGNHSYNSRIQQYTNGVPHPSKQRDPKRLKTKRKYANVTSKYSSVFSRYLKAPKPNNSTKNQQDRLMVRIFGNENNFKMIKSLMNNNKDGQAPKKPHKENSKITKNQIPSGRKEAKDEYTDYYSQQPTTDLDKSVPVNAAPKDKDIELKLEKALLDLSEHKNNFYKDKSGFEKQIEQTKADKDARIRQTFYGQGPYPGSHNVLGTNGVPDSSSINSSNYYKPIAYSTGTRFRPSTQDSSAPRPTGAGEGLSDGNILSNLDCISNDELKERLVVAEMIMKKLFNRNKDLETAVDKANTKIKEVKRNTTQNFFQNLMKEDTEMMPTSIHQDIDETPKNQNTSDVEDQPDDDSEIEIGCKECDKYREKEKKLNQELDKKIKYIFELEQKHITEKYDFDSTTYNKHLQKRLQDIMDENKRYFENYVQVRNMYNDLLESRAIKKRGKRIATESDLLNLKKSLKKAIQLHKEEIKRLRTNDIFGKIEQLTITQENQIRKLEAELARKNALEAKKEKHTKRMFRHNEKLKESAQALLTRLDTKHEKIVSDPSTSNLMSNLSKLVKNLGGDAATAVDED